jgi:hypothetical protein
MPLTITSPEAAVAAAPYLLGFVPHNSMVLLLNADGRNVVVRLDLPPHPDLSWVNTLLNGISEQPYSKVLMLTYSDASAADTAADITRWVADLLNPVMDVVCVLLIGDDEIRSLHADPRDDEDAGFDVASLANHPIVAECIAEGLSCAPHRDALTANLQPVDDEMSKRVVEALRQPAPRVRDYERHRDVLEQRAVGVLHATTDLSEADVICLADACADFYVRDPMITTVLDSHARDLVPLHHVRTRLRYALTHLPDSHVAPVAATMALLAWSDGDGATALIAADRASELDPSNTLAPLVAQALRFGLPPSTWASVTGDIPLEVMRGKIRRTA